VKICIYGAGAGGGHLAVKLAAAGNDISVIARGPHLEAIRQRGLRLRSGAHVLEANVAATDDPTEIGPQDLVVVAVKSTALAQVADKIGCLLASHTHVLFPQNGIPWWYRLGLRDRCPPPPDIPVFSLANRFLASMRVEQIVGGVIYSANEIEAPGLIKNNSPEHNQLDIGAIGGGEAGAVQMLRAMFHKAGIASPAVDDIRRAVWMKLLANMSGSTIALVSRSQSSIARKDPALREIFCRLVEEGLAIAAAQGFSLDLNAETMLTRLMDHKPSLLQDYERSRPMEVAEIILAPAAFARACNVPAPTLDIFAALAARMAADRTTPSPS
jgi:2-dehydropantoate 2-reductase